MPEIRDAATVRADIDALESGEKKNPAKLGKLRKEYIAALEAEIASRGSTGTVGSDGPAPVSVDFAPEPADGLISERDLLAQIVVKAAAEAKPEQYVSHIYNSCRSALRLMRMLREEGGLPADPNPVNLPAYGTLNRDPATGEKRKPKPKPVEAKVTKFETESEKTVREAQEKARDGEEAGESQMDKAARIAQALAEAGDPQWATSEYGQAELAQAGIRQPAAKVTKGI